MKKVTIVILVILLYSMLLYGGILNQKQQQVNGHTYWRLTRTVTWNEIERYLFAGPNSSVWLRFQKVDGSGNEIDGFAVRVTTDIYWNRIVYSDYGNWIKSYGDHPGDYQFAGPHGICRATYVEETGMGPYTVKLYVADGGNGKVVELEYNDWDEEINYLREFSGFQFPYDVDYDDNGTPFQPDDDYLWVADPTSNKIYKVRLLDGVIVKEYGEYGSDSCQFINPHYIAVGKGYEEEMEMFSSDDIFVVDNLNHRLVHLVEDDEGNIQWKETFNYSDSSWSIKGINTDVFNNLWVSEASGSKILLFNNRLYYVGRYGEEGLGQTPGYLYLPEDIDVLYRTNLKNGDYFNRASDALFCTEIWSDGSGQIRYEMRPDITYFKYQNIYKDPNGNLYVEEPDATPNKKGIESSGTELKYDGTNFNFKVSMDCSLKVRIYEEHNHTLIRTFDWFMVPTGLNSLYWHGDNDNGSSFFYPGTPMAIVFEMKSLYKDLTIPVTKYFNQSSGQGKNLLSVKENSRDEHLIRKFRVYQNYPNPFNSITKIRYDLPEKGKVKIEIYNILGQRVRTLVNEEQKRGEYEVLWDGRFENNNEVSSGVYFIKISVKSQIENLSKIIKICIVK